MKWLLRWKSKTVDAGVYKSQPVRARVISNRMFSWESQAEQYTRWGLPGVGLETHFEYGSDIHCLLYRDDDGILVGILNFYPDGVPGLEDPGNVNVWVRPDRQRRGIGSVLVDEAIRLWDVSPHQQNYTGPGLALLRRAIREHDPKEKEVQ